MRKGCQLPCFIWGLDHKQAVGEVVKIIKGKRNLPIMLCSGDSCMLLLCSKGKGNESDKNQIHYKNIFCTCLL